MCFRGSEPLAEEAVKMICHTGGVAVLAHPWALKHPVPIVRRLKEAGLHGMEVHKSDGKLAGTCSVENFPHFLIIKMMLLHSLGLLRYIPKQKFPTPPATCPIPLF